MSTENKIITLTMVVEYTPGPGLTIADIIEAANESVISTGEYGNVKIAKLSPIGEIDLT